MVIPILASAAGLSTVLFLVAVVVAARRADRISALQSEIADHERRAGEFQARYDDKCRQADDLRSKLDKTRDEIKKVKKKAFEKERSEKERSTPPDDERERAQEEALLEAKAEAKRRREQAGQAKEEAARAREQVAELKAEALDLKKTLEDKKDELARAQNGESGRVKDLEKQLRKLRDKLESANRRARTDAQVYRVTNSKLELAMEKIAGLEKRLEADKPSSEQGPPSD